MSEKLQRKLLTPEFVVVWPHLFKPHSFKKNDSDNARYSAELLFDKETDIDEIKDAIKEVAHLKWGKRKLSDLQLPLKDGDKLADEALKRNKKRDYLRGNWLLRTKSVYAPVVCDTSHDDILDERTIFSGCFGIAEINLVPYESAAANIGDGITAYINAYMHIRPGKRIGGRDASSIFGQARLGDVDPDDYEYDEDETEDADAPW